jgi:hypothetical protein
MGVLRASSASPGSLDAPYGVEASLSFSIREEEAALCLDCLVTFNVRNRSCPQCDGEQFWLTARWKRPPATLVPTAALPFQRPGGRASPRLRRAR